MIAGRGGRTRASFGLRSVYRAPAAVPWGANALCAGQHQLRPQAPDRRGAELELAAIEAGHLHHDRQSEARPRFGLVQPPPTAGNLLALRGRKSRTIVVDRDADDPPAFRPVQLLREYLDGDPRLRPFAGIVDQIAQHLLEILALAAKLRVIGSVEIDGDAALEMDLLHGA